jgi:hypothetical protein
MGGAFAGGDRLVEEDFANRLPVCRTPIRKTLHALAARALATRATRTWTVHRLDVRDVRAPISSGNGGRTQPGRSIVTAVRQAAMAKGMVQVFHETAHPAAFSGKLGL